MAKEQVLIAGCGDIGGALALQLAAAGFAVAGLRRNAALLPPGIEPLAADLGDRATLAVLERREFGIVVVSSAASRHDAQSYRRVYVDGLRNLLEALRGEPRLLLVSSTGVYHQHHGEWVDESSPTEPATFSGQLLLEAEALLRDRAPRRSTVLRFGGIYGPGRERLIDEVRAGIGCAREPPRYTNRVHREDCVGMLRFLVERIRNGTATAACYLGVDDEPAPMWELRQWLAARLGVKLDDARAISGGSSPGSKRCSNRRIRAQGYELRYPDFRAGYSALLESFRTAPPS